MATIADAAGDRLEERSFEGSQILPLAHNQRSSLSNSWFNRIRSGFFLPLPSKRAKKDQEGCSWQESLPSLPEMTPRRGRSRQPRQVSPVGTLGSLISA